MTGITTNNVKRRSAGGRNRTTTVKRPLRTACRMDPRSNPAALSLAAIGPRPIATLGLALMRSVALLPGRLHRLRGVLGRHGASRHLGDNVVDHPTDRRAEDLIIEVLVIGRARELLRDVAHEGVVERRVRAGNDRDDEAFSGQPGLHLGRDERLDEVDRLLGRALAHDPADDPAERIGRRSRSAGHYGELEPADLIVRKALLVGRDAALLVVDDADGER